VTTGPEAAARDQAAIAAGTSAFSLMLRAGTVAAACILRDYSDRLSYGVALFAGSGSNGGDAYVVAAQLARAGVAVRLHAAAQPRTDDARRAQALAEPALRYGAPTGKERLVVDGLLGTGHTGALRNAVATAAGMLGLARDRGSRVVALDLPSGLDASTGEIADGSVAADDTLCFGSLKRGVLLQRKHAGRVLVLDIGVRGPFEPDDRAWRHPDDMAVARMLPEIAWNAHKGTRGHVAVVGGAEGMAGAVTLATRAALASGAGLVRSYVAAPGVPAVQQGAPQAIALPWPSAEPRGADAGPDAHPWGDAVAIGPGLGRSPESLALLQHAVTLNRGRPCVFDADALTLAAMPPESGGSELAAQRLAGLIGQAGQSVITPHAGEFARLTGRPIPTDWTERADAVQRLAAVTGAVVLLKGTPTLVCAPDGTSCTAVARGTALLAAGGSGDMLTGIIAALLAADLPAYEAAVLGATAHGLAAEIATAQAGGIRGLTLEAVLGALPDAWRTMAHPATLPQDILSALPSPVH
jgi:NAD(P)H-hydrate epimerase